MPEQNASAQTVELILFWEPSCPYCERARVFLAKRPDTQAWIKVLQVDISSNPANQALFLRASRLFAIARPGVPLIVVGERPILGFDDEKTTGAAILDAAQACRDAGGCRSLQQLLEDEEPKLQQLPGKGLPAQVSLPLIGTISFKNLSLPALTILLAAIDGFNPCAMWVLVFLIGLLAGMQDRARMWLLGGAFLLTSSIVYFAFLAAWLNVFLVLGALAWVRIAVGLVALTSGGYYLYSFATNAAAECRVTNLDQRRRIMEALRSSVYEQRFLAALAGIVVLAAAVNLMELFCSAGIPAVYTDVLAMSNLGALQYYSYLLLYVLVFMIDDAIIFATAMLTLKATGLTTKYLRVSHVVGGVAMAVIGILLIVKPEMLAFGA